MMELKDFIGAVVFGAESKKRYVLRRITAPCIEVMTVEKDARGNCSFYCWPTINGDPISTGVLLFEDASLTEPFKEAFEAYSHTQDAYFETVGYTERFAAFYADKFAEQYGLKFSDEERSRIIEKLTKVKRDEREWLGYMLLPDGMEWEDITPLRDAPNAKGGISKATHMDYNDLYDILPKIDILHHRAYDQLQKLFALTGTKPMDVNYQDPAVYTVFEQLDTCGIPEFASDFTKGLLAQLGRIRFSELVSVSGMAHGTDAWNGNGEYLMKEHPICELISTRDDVFLTLRKFDVPREQAVIAMKHTQRGKYHNDTESKREMFDYLRWVGVPDWYIESMERIWYLFPKAHAAHYAKLAVSLAWFKHYYPKEFYQVLLSGDDHEELLLCSNEELERQLGLLDRSSHKERDAIKLLLEARRRGYIPAVSTSK